MNYVVDASVLIKLFIPEILSDKAVEFFSSVDLEDSLLIAPDLIFPEIGNILWKKAKFKELASREIVEIINAIELFPLKIEPSKPVFRLAVEIGMNHGITVYDAIYIALARIYDASLATADRKLIEALQATEFAECVNFSAKKFKSD